MTQALVRQVPDDKATLREGCVFLRDKGKKRFLLLRTTRLVSL
jgi:hypothetical protein